MNKELELTVGFRYVSCLLIVMLHGSNTLPVDRRISVLHHLCHLPAACYGSRTQAWPEKFPCQHHPRLGCNYDRKCQTILSLPLSDKL